MAKSAKALFGTSTTYAIADDSSDVEGATIRNDYPPSAQNVASAFIHNNGAGDNILITVKFQLYSGVDWGAKHTCEDSNGDAITFYADSEETIEVNLYSQPEWKLADAWRILLSRAGSTALNGKATAVII